MTTPRGREHTRPEEARAPGCFVERPAGPGARACRGLVCDPRPGLPPPRAQGSPSQARPSDPGRHSIPGPLVHMPAQLSQHGGAPGQLGTRGGSAGHTGGSAGHTGRVSWAHRGVSWAHGAGQLGTQGVQLGPRGGSAGHTGAWALCSEPQQAENRPQRPLEAQSHTSHPSTTASRRPPHLPGQSLHRQPQLPAQLSQEQEPGEQHSSGHAAHAPACRGGRDGNPTALCPHQIQRG